MTGNAGASGPDASEMIEDGAITDENAGRERKTSRDSERSCPSLPKQKKVIEIIDTALEASWNEIFTFFIDHLKDLKSVNGIQAIPYLQVSLIISCFGINGGRGLYLAEYQYYVIYSRYFHLLPHSFCEILFLFELLFCLCCLGSFNALLKFI